MSEYIIYRKTPCDLHGQIDCNGTLHCAGYVPAPVDADEWLLSRLAKLMWDERWGEHTGTTKEMNNLRFEGDEKWRMTYNRFSKSTHPECVNPRASLRGGC